ncbi:MAG: GNAT family N-acetyltransferase [Lachnospiraceae bacterium]|nr:GNAT family N-acetyltransferase [Lachnospiraceae bacterium]
MEVIGIDEIDRWNNKIMGFSDWDIYYLNEYARSFELHGDGKPILLYAEVDGCRMAYAMMQNDIADDPHFEGRLAKNTLWDWTTPYGYGGPLVEGELSEQWMKNVMCDIKDYAAEHNIVSQFFRFHPLTQNQKPLEGVSDVVYMKKTVYIDTSSRAAIDDDMTSNNRNMVRKAEKNGVRILTDQGERLDEFIAIYEETMKHRNAEEYYYFDRSYFDYIIQYMKEYIRFYYAEYQGRIISASIFFYNSNYMHYHLSGTLYEYRNLGAANLILTEAAYWAAEHGITRFHLGGGVGIEDSLLRFKKHFNRNGLIDFCIGRNIFMQGKYDELVNIRKEDPDFDENRPFMILYRS